MASTKPTTLSAEPSQVPKVNQFGIPLLPDGLRERLFAGEETAAGESVLRSANELLKKFDLNTKGGEKDAARPPPSFSAPEMPPLYGNIESHFHHIAEEQVCNFDLIGLFLIGSEPKCKGQGIYPLLLSERQYPIFFDDKKSHGIANHSGSSLLPPHRGVRRRRPTAPP